MEDTMSSTNAATTAKQTGERSGEQTGDQGAAQASDHGAAQASDHGAAQASDHGAAQADAGAAVRTLPLWRNPRFQTLWIGTTASTLGVSVADIAYPLTILAITRSPALAGLFAAVQVIGMLMAGLPSGVLADRYDLRTIVILTETARAAVTGIVVVALITGWLSLPVLLGAAVLLGIGQAIKGSAQILLLRSVVPPGQLTQALTQDEVRINGAALAGPALGGALYGIRALAHAVPFLFTAVSFLVALITAVMMKFMPDATRDAADQSAGRTGRAGRGGAAPSGKSPAQSGNMLVGVRTLWNQPVLRAATLLIMFVNTIGAGLELVIIVILRDQAVPSGTIGLALGLGAAGGLAGAPLVKVLHRLRPGVLMLSMCLLDVAILALLAVPFGPWWVAGLMFSIMLGVPALRVLVDILVIRQAPAEQRGRVVAALMTLISLGMPVGLAGCGLLLQYLPAQTAMLTLAAIEATGVAYGSTRRELWQARWPADPAA
jgi:predicted MFS family arabinose efflux permease